MLTAATFLSSGTSFTLMAALLFLQLLALLLTLVAFLLFATFLSAKIGLFRVGELVSAVSRRNS